MDDQLVTKKIQALLHDPPEKAIILGRIGHEGRAREIMRRFIDEARIPDDVRDADHIASAADRINFPKNEGFLADFLEDPIIVHPLSGRRFDLKSLAQLDPNAITAAVDRAVVYLADKYGNDKEKVYLALWRELLDVLKDGDDGESRLGQLWELLPADTRIPDHSIWDHKRVTAAIAGALPQPAFLLFAIGPVQDFIATARKTQDLWAGSYLLSYLAWRAMETVADEFGPDSIIFPDLCRQPMVDLWLISKGLDVGKPSKIELSSPTLPNRFFAVVPEAAAKDIAERAGKAVRDAFIEACTAVRAGMERVLGIDAGAWIDLWERQTKGLIETYSACTPIDKPDAFLDRYTSLMGIRADWAFGRLFREYKEKGFEPNVGTVYGQVYRLTEKALGSRKALRDFGQEAEPNYKCTLCGVREPIHPGTYNGQECVETFGALRGFWQEKVLGAFPEMRASERLCGVCATKRLAARFFLRDAKGLDVESGFPSVSMVATAAFKLRAIERMENPSAFVAVTNFVEAVRGLTGEGRWSGVPVPMVRRACRSRESSDFGSLEGDWLYKEAFDNRKVLWEENKSRLSADQFEKLLQNAKAAQQRLFDSIAKGGREEIGLPSIYYVVLLMDGDDMGKWLSGDKAPTIDEVLHPTVKNSLDASWGEMKGMTRPLNPSLHLATSKALRDFSLHVVREIVEKDHLGKLVYAGGDDVLALVNLRDLLPVMRKLRAYFSGSIAVAADSKEVEIDFKNGAGLIPVDDRGLPLDVGRGRNVKGFMLSMGAAATTSMGVIIAHHSSNLSQVLEEARKCEKTAKKTDGKNGFCLALAKRAGGTENLSAHWYYGDDCFESIPLLQTWADAFYRDALSPKLSYTFRAETNGLQGLPSEAIRAELLRIAERHRNKKAQGFNGDDLKGMIEGLMRLFTGGMDLKAISVFLSVAAFLGREGNR
jgi:CRISPR-associated protein Cmr2